MAYQVYKQEAGAARPTGEVLEPGWYWVRTRCGYGEFPEPVGDEVGPYKNKLIASAAAKRAERDTRH